jgi:hypothetical protein
MYIECQKYLEIYVYWAYSANTKNKNKNFKRDRFVQIQTIPLDLPLEGRDRIKGRKG